MKTTLFLRKGLILRKFFIFSSYLLLFEKLPKADPATRKIVSGYFLITIFAALRKLKWSLIGSIRPTVDIIYFLLSIFSFFLAFSLSAGLKIFSSTPKGITVILSFRIKFLFNNLFFNGLVGVIMLWQK